MKNPKRLKILIFVLLSFLIILITVKTVTKENNTGLRVNVDINQNTDSYSTTTDEINSVSEVDNLVISTTTSQVLATQTNAPKVDSLKSNNTPTTTAPTEKRVEKPVVTFTPEQVYEKWNPYVVSVECTIVKDGKNYKSKGSGTLVNHYKDGASIQVTRHTVQETVQGVYGNTAESCKVSLPSNATSFVIDKKDFITNNGEIDVAYLKIANQSSYIENLLSKVNNSQSCQTLSLNEPVMLIGFPNGTATTKSSYVSGKIIGDMNGYTGGVYIKSEINSKSGYSGGALLSISNNCYIGMGTFSPGSDPSTHMTLNISLNGLLKDIKLQR